MGHRSQRPPRVGSDAALKGRSGTVVSAAVVCSPAFQGIRVAQCCVCVSRTVDGRTVEERRFSAALRFFKSGFSP